MIEVDSEKFALIMLEWERYNGDLAAARIARLLGFKELEDEYVKRICDAEYWKVDPPEARTVQS